MRSNRSDERVAALLAWAGRTRVSGAPRAAIVGVTAARLVIGVIFLMSGTLKEVLPSFHATWVGMIRELGLPLQPVAIQLGAVLEIAVGLLLLAGLLARLAALGGLGLMVGAAWIHLTVTSTPLPPDWYPILTALACALVLWQGAGAWSLDRRRATGAQRVPGDAPSGTGSRATTG